MVGVRRRSRLADKTLAALLLAGLLWTAQEPLFSGQPLSAKPWQAQAASPAQQAAAAQAPDEQVPIFRAQSRLVLVPAVVTDSHMAPVTGLQQGDLQLLEDGTPQKVAVFEEEHTTNQRLQYARPPAGIYDNFMTGSSASKRLTILVLDTLNTPFSDQAHARHELVKFLAKEVNRQEPVALLTIGRHGTRVIHDFTEDPAALAAALRRVSGELPSGAVDNFASPSFGSDVAGLTDFVSEADASMALIQTRDRVIITLQAFQHVAQAVAVLPGRKSMVWISAGFPFYLDPDTASRTGLSPRGGTPFIYTQPLSDLGPLYERTVQELNRANIAVYPVDPQGVTGRLGTTSRDTMNNFADLTGGRVFAESNDLAGLFQKAADDSASYYMLGYYLPADIKPGWHRLQVKARNPALRVRARNGFFVLGPPKDAKDAAETQRVDVEMALVSPMNYTGIPMAVRWLGPPAGSGPKKDARFEITVLPQGVSIDEEQNNALSLEVVAAARDAAGKDVDHFSQHIAANLKPGSVQRLIQQGLHYTSAIEVPPGQYSVRFVVRDNLTGRMGSVLAPLKVM